MNINVSPQLCARISNIRFHVKTSVVFKFLRAYGKTDGRTQRSYQVLHRNMNRPDKTNYKCSITRNYSASDFLATCGNKQESAFVHLTWRCSSPRVTGPSCIICGSFRQVFMIYRWGILLFVKQNTYTDKRYKPKECQIATFNAIKYESCINDT